MKRTPEAEGQRWLSQAEEDLDTAQLLLRGRKYYMVCFLAQQIAEKALKAYLYFKGREMVTGHSVEELCRQAAILDSSFKNLRREVSSLDTFYIPTRYPNGLPDSIPARVFTRKSAVEALRLAQKALTTIKKVMDIG